ncbi:STAS domain-containing protein [[Kitasatospora] papulosa]|uniref:STAS domain-containing protein n=1 Tax=[Kitasatospora] papulosa TaxID=1464011 RepID=A0ABZ1JUM2_9ACTN
MTTPPHHLRLTTVDIHNSVRIKAHGDLDCDSADLFVKEATAQLAARPALSDLHLDCASLGAVDSMGLSALLMIGRRTAAAGVRLHLDDRSANLDRLLELTDTLGHLTDSSPTGAAEAAVTKGKAARPTGPEGFN